MSYKNLYYKYQRIFHAFYHPRTQMIETAVIATGYFDGDWLDFGTGIGGSIIPAYLFSRYSNIKTKFYGFDSWEGCSTPLKGEQFEKGEMKISIDNLKERLRLFEINDVTLTKGFFGDTLNNKLRRLLNITKIKAAYVDVCLYEPSKQALDFMIPYLQNGTVIMFDDWYCHNNRNDLGQQRAVKEWLKENTSIKLTPYREFYWAGKSFIVNLKQ